MWKVGKDWLIPVVLFTHSLEYCRGFIWQSKIEQIVVLWCKIELFSFEYTGNAPMLTLTLTLTAKNVLNLNVHVYNCCYGETWGVAINLPVHTAGVDIYYKVPDMSVKNSHCLVLFHDYRTVHCPTASINPICMCLIAHINSGCHAFVRNNKNYCLNSHVSSGV